MRTVLAIVLFLSVNLNLQSQVIKEWGVGPQVAWNIPLAELGVGARAHLHLSKRLFIAPSVTYFLGLNNIKELNAGLGANLKIWPSIKWTPYLNASGFYNRFISYASSPLNDAQPNNFLFEFGGGLVKNHGCWRPFAEYRVNSKWWESSLTVGILYYFGGCGGRSGGGGGHNDCPAFTRL